MKHGELEYSYSPILVRIPVGKWWFGRRRRQWI